MGRKAGAREEILDVFRDMVLSQPYDEITVSDIVSRAGVARSTFYDHYGDKRAVLLASMEHLLKTLADCAAGCCSSKPDVELLVMHMWDNRSLGRTVFTSNASKHIINALTASICEKTELSPLAGSAIAHGCIGSLASWLSGEISASQDDVIDWLPRNLCGDRYG